MNASWLPGRKFVVTALVSTTMLLVWGTAFGGRSYGPVRAILRALPYGDKVGHFSLYGAMTLGLAMLVRTRNQAIGAGVAVIALGIGDEFRQLTEPNRNFSLGDVLANLGGVSLGLLAALVISRIAAAMATE